MKNPMKNTLLCLLLLAFPLSLTAQEQEAAAQEAAAQEAAVQETAVETTEGSETVTASISLEKVMVTPEKPGIDTLCQLRVQVKNTGQATLTSLRFEVSLAGQTLPVYDKQLFLDELPPGETTEVRLYNFWTTETGRDAPKDGKLKLDVTLVEAQQVVITTDEDGTEVWTLGAAVKGLPLSLSQTLALGS